MCAPSLCAAVVITVLFFLLALIIALLIAALYMGCNEMEPLAIKLAPAQITSLLRYACIVCCNSDPLRRPKKGTTNRGQRDE
jgi:hypothetical protein